MASIEWYCDSCRDPCEPTPEGRCPRCGGLTNGFLIQNEELAPGQRLERMFGPKQAKLEAIIRKVIEYPFHAKRVMYQGTRTSTGRKILVALKEYAEANKISTQSGDWKKEAIALLGYVQDRCCWRIRSPVLSA